MKKNICKLFFVFSTMLLLVTSCNNATQIKFENETNPKFTEDGFADLSLKIGKTPNYKSIFPDDWDDSHKKVLLYRLTGEHSVDPTYTDEAAATQEKKLDKTSTKREDANVFTYEQLISGEAIITLDPIHWDLTLTAYQTKDDPGVQEEPKPRIIDDTKPVLSATVKNIDLTIGRDDVIFDLTTYIPTNKAGSGAPDAIVPVEKSDDQAIGDIDASVKFYMTDVEEKLLDRIVLDIVSIGEKGAETSVLIPANPIVIKKDRFATEGDNFYSVNITHDKVANVHPGDYQLKMTFYDDTTSLQPSGEETILSSKVMLEHKENIKIDGGNLTRANFNIPKGSFNQPPFAPENLKYSTWFAPKHDDGEVAETLPNTYESKLVTIDSLNKVYGQTVVKKIDESTKTNYDEVLKDVTSKNRYNLELSWDDKSFNETSFVINLKTCKGDKDRTLINDVKLNYNKNGNGNETKIDVSKLNLDKYTPATDTGIKYVAGGLGPSENSLTISLPVGVFVQDVFVTAINEMGEGKSLPIANSALYNDPTTEIDEKQAIQNPIGMFTVAYFLQNPDKNSVANIQYSPEPETSTVYFITAHNYGSKDELITTNTLKYPYVKNTKYIFEGWQFKDTDGNFKNINYLSNLDVIPAGDPSASPEKDGKLATTSKLNENVEVIGSWTTPATIKVTFPSYSEYRKLQTAVDQNPYNTVEPIRDVNNEYKVTFTMPTVPNTDGRMSEMVYTIYNPYIYDPTKPEYKVYETAKKDSLNGGIKGIKETEGTPVEGTGGNSLVWNVTEFLSVVGNHGDVYRLNISYKYEKAKDKKLWQDSLTPEYLPAVRIDGNFYIKISK